MLGAFGGAEHLSTLSGGETNGVDAFLQDGILTYSKRNY